MSASRPARRYEAVPLVEIRDRLAAIPAWGWLAALVLLSAGVRFALALRLPGPWIFPDEVRYAELARGVAESGRFTIAGIEFRGFGLVYPVLIAPAYMLFDDPVRAYTAVKAINSLLISLAAVPTYLLAIRFVDRSRALIAASLALFIPSAAYSSVVMTENAFYPIFVAVALLLVMTLERPSAMRQIALVLGCGLAYATRPMALVFVPAFVCAVLVIAAVAASGSASGRRLRAFGSVLWQFRLTWAFGVAAAVLYCVLQLARGEPLSELVGSYPTLLESDYSIGQVARLFLDNLAGVDLAVGVVPLAALAVLLVEAVRARGSDRARLGLTSAGLLLVLGLSLLAAAFAWQAVFRVEERYVFYVSPLLFVAFAVWMSQRRRIRWLDVGCAAVAALLPAVLLRSGFLDFRNVPDSLALWPVVRLVEEGFALWQVGVIVVGASCAAAALFVFLPARLRPLLPLLVAAAFLGAGAHISERMAYLSSNERAAGIAGDRGWIDKHVPDGAPVVSIWSPARPAVNWENEFFSAQLGIGLDFGAAPGWDSVPEIPVRVAPKTGVLLGTDGRPIRVPYVVADAEYRLGGEVVAVDPIGTTLYRFGGPVWLREQVSGIYADKFSGSTVGYFRPACSGGSLELSLYAPGVLFAAPPTILAVGPDGAELARARVPLDREFAFTVPLRPYEGVCAASLTITPTMVPHEVLHTNDYRELGVRFDRVEFVPST